MSYEDIDEPLSLRELASLLGIFAVVTLALAAALVWALVEFGPT